MNNLIDYILINLGGFTLALLLHELYHFLMATKVNEVCMVFGNANSLAYVSSNFYSSETVAYLISFTVMILTFIYSIKRWKKLEK